MVKQTEDVLIKGSGLAALAATASELLNYAAGYKVWLFEGSMGAGKTSLIKAVCAQLGVQDNVTSPTFSLVNEYRAASGPVYHFDFYRVADLEEALAAGVEELFYSGHFCFIEWPEVVIPVLPESYVTVAISVGQGEDRDYKLMFYDNI